MGLESWFGRKPKDAKTSEKAKVDHGDIIALGALAAVGAGIGAGAGVIEQNQNEPALPYNVVAAPFGQVAMGSSADKPASITVQRPETTPTVAETPSTVTPSEQQPVVEHSVEQRYVVPVDKVDGFEKPVVISSDHVEGFEK